MRKNYLLVLMLASLLFSFNSIAQKPIRDAWAENDARIRASYGTVNDRIYDGIIKLSSLNTDRVLVVNLVNEEFYFAKNGGMKESTNDFLFNLNFVADSVFTLLADDSYTKFLMMDIADKQKFEISRLGRFKAKDKTFWNEMMKKYQTKYVLYMKSDRVTDFLTRSNGLFAAQGLHKLGRNVYVYAGMHTEMINMETGKRARGSYSPQSSTDYSPFEYKPFNDFNEQERVLLRHLVVERHINNYNQLLRLMGILK